MHHQLLLAKGLACWLPEDKWLPSLRFCLASILLGFGVYGFTVGVWRSPAMGACVAIKLPLLVFLTLGLNAVLNTILGLLLGSGLGLRQTILCQLMSFAVAGLVLGSIAPVTLLMALDVPGPEDAAAGTSHAFSWFFTPR